MSLADPPGPPQLPLDLGMYVLSFLAWDNSAILRASQNGHRAVVERLLQVPGVKAAAPESICNHGLSAA